MEHFPEDYALEAKEKTFSIRDAGAALLAAAEVKFPSEITCGRCSFRRPFHEPSNHPFEKVRDPFVIALEEFIETVAGQAEQNQQ